MHLYPKATGFLEEERNSYSSTNVLNVTCRTLGARISTLFLFSSFFSSSVATQ